MGPELAVLFIFVGIAGTLEWQKLRRAMFERKIARALNRKAR